MIYMEFTEIFEKLVSVPGPSAYEGERADVICGLLSPYADEIWEDALHNLIVHIRGEGKKLMLEAHADTIGFIVTSVLDGGFLKFEPLGGVVPARLVDVEVRFANGLRGVIAGSRSGFAMSSQLSDIGCGGLYIDTGIRDRKRVEELVRPGDAAVFAQCPRVIEDKVLCSPYLDNLASCACIIKALMESRARSANDLYAVFSAQEENGCRCVEAAVNAVRPDYALTMDITGASDYPASPIPDAGISFGGGPVVKVKDGKTLFDRAFTRRMEELADGLGVPVQHIFMASESNSYRIQRSGTGVVTAGLGIATRNVHTPFEMISLDDAQKCVELVKALIECGL